MSNHSNIRRASNVAVLGLRSAVRIEIARLVRAGVRSDRAFALAMAFCTGRYVS